VVHARGAGAYGFFEPYDDWLAEYTAAKFLTTPGTQTPVLVRFSAVAGSRGSADTVRDVRGFATKFYTAQGNYDLVDNNFPVFFIQDGIKFPDFVHAVKPEPHNEIPQAASTNPSSPPRRPQTPCRTASSTNSPPLWPNTAAGCDRPTRYRPSNSGCAGFTAVRQGHSR
jgi:hypothetical protein